MRKCTYLRNVVRSLYLISLFFSSINYAQNSSFQSAPTFMVLPLTVDQPLAELRTIFTEKLLEDLKRNGFNAVGTRYLTAALQIDTCNSISCMEKIATLVGARYVIYGSLSGDTLTFRLNVKVLDITSHTEISSTERVLVGGSQAMELFMPDLAILISESTKSTITRNNPEPNIANSSQQISTQSDSTAQTISDNKEPSPIHNEIDNNTSRQEPRYANNNAITVQTLDNIQPQPDSSRQQSATGATVVQNQEATAMTNQSSPPLQQNEILQNSSQTDQDTITSVQDTVITTTASLEQPVEQPTETALLDHSNPAGVAKENSTKSRHFKRFRIITSGNMAAATFICGLIVNNRIRHSLNQETEFYNIYMQANRGETSTTYQNYIEQAHYTNRLSAFRAVMYGLSFISASGLALSIYF